MSAHHGCQPVPQQLGEKISIKTSDWMYNSLLKENESVLQFPNMSSDMSPASAMNDVGGWNRKQLNLADWNTYEINFCV